MTPRRYQPSHRPGPMPRDDGLRVAFTIASLLALWLVIFDHPAAPPPRKPELVRQMQWIEQKQAELDARMQAWRERLLSDEEWARELEEATAMLRRVLELPPGPEPSERGPDGEDQTQEH